jgi:hypothetical protein
MSVAACHIMFPTHGSFWSRGLIMHFSTGIPTGYNPTRKPAQSMHTSYTLNSTAPIGSPDTAEIIQTALQAHLRKTTYQVTRKDGHQTLT